jgi:PAS domain S-box-containing protein
MDPAVSTAAIIPESPGEDEAGAAKIASLFFELSKFLEQAPLRKHSPASPGADAAAWTEAAADGALPTMEARYRILVEQIPAVVFMAFIEGGLSEAYVSPQIERMLGFSREEWLDDPIRWYQQIHPDDRARWSMEAATMFATGKPLKSIYRVNARDGRTVWFQCDAKLVRHKDGRPWFIHGVGFDITDLKHTEQALQKEVGERERLQKLEMERQIARTQQSESRLAAIVESSEDPILSKDLDGNITSWNAAATRLFGYEAAEILGQSILVLVPTERHGEEQEILAKLQRGELVEHRETQRVTKSGERLDVSITVSPIRDSDRHVVGASSIARDISERKRSEERLRITEKLAAAGRLAASIAHEVNNPLEAITNLLHLARHEPGLSGEAAQYLAMADQELKRVAHITRQTLGFYRDSTAPSHFDVSEVIDELLPLYANRLASGKVKLETRIGPGASVFGLRGEFQQVISNLLINAMDAMADGEGRLLVRVRRHRRLPDSPADIVRISIADTGPGIPQQVRGKIFDAFYTTKEATGTGLGLWISRSILRKHGGALQVRSLHRPSGGGTVFSVLWPVEPQWNGEEADTPGREKHSVATAAR